VRAILAEQLREYGFEVVEAEDGETALALLRTSEPIDALVTDRSMPGLDGVSLIRRAKALRPGLPAILLTGFAGEANEIASGEFAVLRKPAAAAALLDRLSKILAR
jgi:CheY-like chemotaxis protein